MGQLCALRLSDVDRTHGMLRVLGKGGKSHRITLSPEGLRPLLAYLEQHRFQGKGAEAPHARDDPLFLSETGQALTINAFWLTLTRLRKRAGLSSASLNPALLRETCTLHARLAGGEPEA